MKTFSGVISVLINNYNYEKYVGQAIESALAQTYPSVEVVVVDDGSTDGSRDVIRSYGDRIRAVFKENGGQASAINAGFANSEGDVIMLLDADDYLAPNAAMRIAGLWQPETAVLHHRIQVVQGGKLMDDYLPRQVLKMSSGEALADLMDPRRVYVCPPTSGLVYSRRLLESILPIPEKDFGFCADSYLHIATAFSTPISTLDETLAYYRIHGSNGFAGGVPRRIIKRRKLIERQHFRELRYDLIDKLASDRQLTAPDRKLMFRERDLFDDLMIIASEPGPVSMRARLKQGWATLRRIWAGTEYSLGRKARDSMLIMLLSLAPRPIVKSIYPGLFT